MERRTVLPFVVVGTLSTACFGVSNAGWNYHSGSSDTAAGSDNDFDGFDEGEDCDDEDPAVNPGAPELCADEVDNNCDAEVDEDDCEETVAESTGLDWERLDWCTPEGSREGLREWRRVGGPFIVRD
jgi:hypothetical protein